MVITSNYYQLYYHYKELKGQYGTLTDDYHAYNYICNVLSDYLNEPLHTQREMVVELIHDLEASNPVRNLKAIYLEEVKSLKQFLEKTKGEYSE